MDCISVVLFIFSWVKFLILSYILLLLLYILNLLFSFFLILSGDIELNPGPVNARNRQCYVLYLNVRELHGNLHDLTVASKQFYISLCSENLVSNMKHDVELSIPDSKRPILLKHDEINKAQGMATYIRSGCSAAH